MAMDERKQRVLRAIVSLYSVEGEPVGSSVLANYFDMAVSSATLRNEMAALTRLGLLEQPHTSAGRVPSAKGYRYYIDHLLDDSQPLDRVARARVDSVFASLDHEPDRLAQGAVKALAQMSGYTAAVSTPCADDLCIAHFEVVQVGRNAAAILAVTSAGYVRTRVARVRDGLTREKASQLAALLNRNLTFVAAVDLSRRALADLCSQIPRWCRWSAPQPPSCRNPPTPGSTWAASRSCSTGPSWRAKSRPSSPCSTTRPRRPG